MDSLASAGPQSAASRPAPGRARTAGRRCTALLGALALACAGGNAAPSPPETAFDAQRAWKHLETMVSHGPRPSGSEALERTRQYLESELRALGLEPVREPFTADTPIGPIEMCNLWADVSAPGAGAPILVLASHFDTKRMDEPFVGANDAGSSTAVLLELARVLAAAPAPPMTLRLLFLDGEEAVRDFWAGDDNTYGSRHHARRIAEDPKLRERVRAAVVIDMVGDADLRLEQDRNSHRRLQEIFFEAAHAVGLGDHVDGPMNTIQDDHLPFRRILNIPAAVLIDLEYGPGNSYWHTVEDTLDKCSSESLGIAGRIVLAGLPPAMEYLATR